jgi:hypothetical protein
MENIAIKETPCNGSIAQFGWKDNLSVQKVLDVIVSILAEEYIGIAKENPETFKTNGGSK